MPLETKSKSSHEYLQVLILGIVARYASKQVSLSHTPLVNADLNIRTIVSMLRNGDWICDNVVTRDFVKDCPVALKAFSYLVSRFRTVDLITQLQVTVYPVRNTEAGFSIAIMPGIVENQLDFPGVRVGTGIRDYRNVFTAGIGLLNDDTDVPFNFRTKPDYTPDNKAMWTYYIDSALRLGWDILPDYVQAAIAADAFNKATAFVAELNTGE